MADGKKNIVATQITPKPEEAPIFDIPLQELDISKAGVGDLFNKHNEIVRTLNAITTHLKIDKNTLLKSVKESK